MKANLAATSTSSSWESLHKLTHLDLGSLSHYSKQILVCLFVFSLSVWMGNVRVLPSSGLSTNVLWSLDLGLGWATQGQSETWPEVTTALRWSSFQQVLPCRGLWVTAGFLVTSWTKTLFAWSLRLAGLYCNSKRRTGGSKLIPFYNYGESCASRNTQNLRISLALICTSSDWLSFPYSICK